MGSTHALSRCRLNRASENALVNHLRARQAAEGKGEMMTSRFTVLQAYTRDQVADVIGMPVERRGGAWDTGYDEWQGEVFIFANVGVAGRTGHDYRNRWADKKLVWYGKTRAKRGQPQIDRIVSNTVPVHIFWRGSDRAPFTYAGQGIALEATNDAPIEVLWGFDEHTLPIEPNGKVNDSSVPVWRRGPPPAKGHTTITKVDGLTEVYVLRLWDESLGLVDLPEGHVVIKVGISNEIERRLRELNAGFPPGSKTRWILASSRLVSSARDAWELEGRCLEQLRRNGQWIGGEFAAIPRELLTRLLDK